MEPLHYVLVAERSVLPSIDAVVGGLEKNGAPSAISIVVPRIQVPLFEATRCRQHAVIPEDKILPSWPLSRVRALLPRQPGRAGWYLQQFLKLSFGMRNGIERYVVWDADTVMLRRPPFWIAGDRLNLTSAREHHQPYFDTYQRLFGEAPKLSVSVIAQYMPIETSVVREMCAEIEARQGRDWLEAILRGLPGESPSEFSEYETYANYLERRTPGTIVTTRQRWFRHGSEIVPLERRNDLRLIESTFSRYVYVSFERHPSRPLKRAAARLLLLTGRSDS
jgi:hypothetical protein